MQYKKNSDKKHEAVQSRPLEVKVYGSLEEALKRFKTYFQRERILGELKERETYEKPSIKKRRKKREAEQRRLLTESREKMIASGEWQKQQKKKNLKRQKKIDGKDKDIDSDE